MSNTFSTEDFSRLVATRVKLAHAYSHYALSTRVFIRSPGVIESRLQWLVATNLSKTLRESGVNTDYGIDQVSDTVREMEEGEIFIRVEYDGDNRGYVAVDVYAKAADGNLWLQPFIKANLQLTDSGVDVTLTFDIIEATAPATSLDEVKSKLAHLFKKESGMKTMKTKMSTVVLTMLKGYRTDAKLTKADMAKQFDMPRGTYSRIELGRYRLTLERLQLIAAVMDLTIHDMLYNAEQISLGLKSKGWTVSLNCDNEADDLLRLHRSQEKLPYQTTLYT